MTTRSNFLISALNTNLFIQILTNDYDQDSIFLSPTYYVNKSAYGSDALYGSPCDVKSSTTQAGFYALPYYENVNSNGFWPGYPPYFEPSASALVDGFFGACTPLDAVLASTFDCLYNINCLNLFTTYFPGLNQVCMI
jgi:hypothetical protein